MTGPVVMADYALGYAAEGWSVFPLNGKVPRTLHGHLDQLRTPSRSVRGGACGPTPISAPRCPRPSSSSTSTHATANDRSPARDAADDDGLVRTHGRRTAPLLRRPVNVQLTSTRLPQGIDLKKNGYLVMPPSLHPATGQPYTWQVLVDQPPARLTRELLNLVTYRPRNGLRLVQGGAGSGDGLIRVVAEATEGGKGKSGRNDALCWAACRSAEEGRLEDLRDRLRDAALSTGLTELEVDRTLESAATRETSGGAA